MITVSPDMKVETDTPTAKRAQEGMLELLLANHPLDCPVCDKGGECPLQDQTFSHGPGESRYVEEKRHFEKPIPISDHVLLDRERCILCDRCTRFADEVAGDKLIHFIDRGNATQVNTFPDEPFASYFSGNTVQICPVGALTAKPYRFKARPWDLEQVESTCTTCSVGCRISIQSSRDELLRVQGVDTGPIPSRSTGVGCATAAGSTSRRSSRICDSVTHWCAARPASADTSWSSALAIATQLFEGAESIALLGGARSIERGRVRAGRDSPTRSASPIATPNSATACRPRCSACRAPPSTRPPTRRPCAASARTSRKSCRCCTCGCVTRPSGAARRSSSSRRRRPACRATPGAACATPRAWARPRSPRRSPTPRSPNRSPPVTSCVVAGRSNLAVVRRHRPGGSPSGARRRSELHRAARAPPRQCRRRAAARAGADRRRPRRARHAAGRRRRPDRSPGAARRRSDQRLPRRRSRPSGADRRTTHHLDRHVPVRIDPAGRPRAAGRRVRRAERHHHQPRGSRHRGSNRRSACTAPLAPTG